LKHKRRTAGRQHQQRNDRDTRLRRANLRARGHSRRLRSALDSSFLRTPGQSIFPTITQSNADTKMKSILINRNGLPEGVQVSVLIVGERQQMHKKLGADPTTLSCHRR
jgi:hypothetical protein